MQRKIKMSLQRLKRRNLRQHPPDKLSQNTTEIPFEDWRLLQTKPHIISMDTSLELGRIRQTSNSGAFTEAAELAWFNGVPEVHTTQHCHWALAHCASTVQKDFDNDLRVGEDNGNRVRAL